MSVSPQDVEKVALLARLAISETNLSEVTERFSRVLGLVDELNTIDTETVVPCRTLTICTSGCDRMLSHGKTIVKT